MKIMKRERVAGELIAHHFINKTNYKDYAILTVATTSRGSLKRC